MIFCVFNRLLPFPKVFGQIKEQLIFELYEMAKVLHVVACPMNFNLLLDLGEQLAVLKMLLFQIFIPFQVIFLTFRVGYGFICAKYDWLVQNFPLCICFGAIMLLHVLKMFFKSRNTANTEYLNVIPNPESQT